MSEINEIKRQFANGQWKKFIKSIKISNLRGWTGQTIDFRFPISVIVGENGIGKSTILRAAACAYNDKNGQTLFPANLFLATQWDGTSIQDAVIEYEIQEGDKTSSSKYKKNAERWRYSPDKNKPTRHFAFFDISRTLPLDATAGYARIAKLSNSEGENNRPLNEESLRWLSHVLCKEYLDGRFTNTNIQTNKEVGLLKRDFGEVSQFHQGSGEGTALGIFNTLQSIPEQSLLIIDEIEASLHPLAQRGLIEYLIHLCRTKKLQIILSTHSPFIVESLPLESRIMIMQSDKKEIMYNMSTNFALSFIDSVLHPDLYIFVEDEEAENLLIEIIKQSERSDDILRRVSLRAAGSADIVDTLNRLSAESKLPYKSISFIDGDKKNEFSDCPYLPGDMAPEKVIFTGLKNLNWNNLDNRFGLGAGLLYKTLNDAMLAPDHHDWTTIVGDRIKQSKDYVWSVLIAEWCKQCLEPTEKERILDIISNAINVS